MIKIIERRTFKHNATREICGKLDLVQRGDEYFIEQYARKPWDYPVYAWRFENLVDCQSEFNNKLLHYNDLFKNCSEM